jgi:hypothetical protein
MVEQVLAAHARPAVRVGVVAPAEYARVGQVVQEQVAQPVDAVGVVACCLRLLAVSVQAVNRDDAGVDCISRVDRWYGYEVGLPRRPDRCLHTPPASLGGWHQLFVLAARPQALLLSRMWRVSQEPECASERVGERSILGKIPLRRLSSSETGRVVASC